MPRVRNVSTGLCWDVPVGHYSLSSALYEVLAELKPEPAPAPAAAVEPERVKKPTPRKNARKE